MMDDSERGEASRLQSKPSASCKARRYAVKYNPATIVLEYETPTQEKRLRSVKVQGLDTSDVVPDTVLLTEKVIRSFPRTLDRKSVSVKQVQRLVEKLIEASNATKAVSKANPDEFEIGYLRRVPVRCSTESFGMSVDSIADAETDLNKLSVKELNEVKAVMDVNFKKNLIGKDDPNFQYDVQVDFNPEEDNDWDDSDED